jgi:predicted AlkP superfamily phosphohydrolase/phosphomutase
VAPGEYEALRRDLVTRLRELRGDDGRAVFQVVGLREEIYDGPYRDDAPDIATWPAEPWKVRMGSDQRRAVTHVIDSEHALEGIFAFAGPAFRPLGRVADLGIADVAPTLLHVLGLPVPDDMDGRVVTQWLHPDDPAARTPVRACSPCDRYAGVAAGADARGEELVLEKLRALGYVE